MSRVLVRDCTYAGSVQVSVYVEGGRVSKVGEFGPESVPSDTEVIEAKGGTLLPGLIDSHCHPFEYGWLKRSVDLRGTTNITGLRLRVQAGVQRARPGEWVTGMGWDQEAFPGKQMPSRRAIDDISPSNPVALSRVCGHIALLNGAAINALGLESLSGAEYERDGTGALTGIVKEGALSHVFSRVPRSVERAASDLQAVEAEASRLGLTALHCVVSPEGYREELEALAALESADSLSIKYRVYAPPESLEWLEATGWRRKLSGTNVRLNGVKLYTDGSLGARTAALREPYADDPSNTGLLRYSDEGLRELVVRADSLGHQVIVHAIGDRAVEQAIDALSVVAGARNPRRHRIEHASLLPGDLRQKLAKHGIRATVQPLFITSDTWAVERLGAERVNDLYPLRSMFEEGIGPSGSSDSPVESLSPVLGMWASMTRGGSVPSESLTLDQATALYTSNAAYNGFDEQKPSEGVLGDFTLLDSDVSGMHPALFRKVGVVATIVDGVVVHSYGG